VFNLLPLLQKKGIIGESDIDDITKESQESNHSVEEVLQGRGISDQDILTAKGEHWDIPVRSLKNITIPYDILQYIPEESAIHYHVVPIALVDEVLEVGIVDPDNIDALDALNFISTKKGVPFKAFLISERDYKKAIDLIKTLMKEDYVDESWRQTIEEDKEGLDMQKKHTDQGQCSSADNCSCPGQESQDTAQR